MTSLKFGRIACLVSSAWLASQLAFAADVPVVDASDAIEVTSPPANVAPPKAQAAAPVPARRAVAAQDADDEEETVVAAQAPASTPASTEPATGIQTLTLSARVYRLEQQMAARTQADALAQVGQLRQQVADLRGQVEDMNHSLQQVQQQLAAKPQVAAAADAKTAAVTTTSEDDPAELQSYQKAYDMLKNRDFAKARASLSDYVRQFPKGKFAAQAHYWLGEVYLQQGSPQKAVSEFTLVTNNPENAKYQEAMLKLGIAYAEQNDWNHARQQFNLVQQQFPGTTVAKLAGARLQELNQQGH